MTNPKICIPSSTPLNPKSYTLNLKPDVYTLKPIFARIQKQSQVEAAAAAAAKGTTSSEKDAGFGFFRLLSSIHPPASMLLTNHLNPRPSNYSPIRPKYPQLGTLYPQLALLGGFLALKSMRHAYAIPVSISCSV